MKFLLVLLAAVACTVESAYYGYPGFYSGYRGFPYAGHYGYPSAYGPAFHQTQYHAQDELGQASFGHSAPFQAHAAVRDHMGGVAGSYSYISPEGKEIYAKYIADSAGGFRVVSNALPVAPTYEGQAPIAPVYTGVAPQPVQDTPEVAAAKAEHLAAVEAAKAGERKKREVFAYTSHPIGFHGLPLTYGAYTHHGPAAHVREAELTKIVLNPRHAVAYIVN